VRGFLNLHLKNTRDYVNQSGLSRQAIFNAVNASLECLDTSYIDLLQIYRADLDNVTAEETMKALHDLVQSGKVRYIGASSMWTWQFAHYNNVADKVGSILNCLQITLNQYLKIERMNPVHIYAEPVFAHLQRRGT
jgi:aryl-alcohol dehydrogenase-like predicted oxidoreductase